MPRPKRKASTVVLKRYGESAGEDGGSSFEESDDSFSSDKGRTASEESRSGSGSEETEEHSGAEEEEETTESEGKEEEEDDSAFSDDSKAKAKANIKKRVPSQEKPQGAASRPVGGRPKIRSSKYRSEADRTLCEKIRYVLYRENVSHASLTAQFGWNPSRLSALLGGHYPHKLDYHMGVLRKWDEEHRAETVKHVSEWMTEHKKTVAAMVSDWPALGPEAATDLRAWLQGKGKVVNQELEDFLLVKIPRLGSESVVEEKKGRNRTSSSSKFKRQDLRSKGRGKRKARANKSTGRKRKRDPSPDVETPAHVGLALPALAFSARVLASGVFRTDAKVWTQADEALRPRLDACVYKSESPAFDGTTVTLQLNSAVESSDLGAFTGSEPSDGRSFLNAGASIQAMEWVPRSHSHAQFLALATDPESKFHLIKQDLDSVCEKDNTIQLWEMGSFDSEEHAAQKAAPVLRMVIFHGLGHVCSMKWLPSSSSSSSSPALLGTVALSFASGAIRVFSVPELPSAEAWHAVDLASLRPLELQAPDFSALSMVWMTPSARRQTEAQDSHVELLLAAGSSRGSLAVWDVGSQRAEPSHLCVDPLSVSELPIIALEAVDACRVVAVAGNGSVSVWDVRKMTRPLAVFGGNSQTRVFQARVVPCGGSKAAVLMTSERGVWVLEVDAKTQTLAHHAEVNAMQCLPISEDAVPICLDVLLDDHGSVSTIVGSNDGVSQFLQFDSDLGSSEFSLASDIQECACLSKGLDVFRVPQGEEEEYEPNTLHVAQYITRRARSFDAFQRVAKIRRKEFSPQEKMFRALSMQELVSTSGTISVANVALNKHVHFPRLVACATMSGVVSFHVVDEAAA
jgi:WD40 repeat protein